MSVHAHPTLYSTEAGLSRPYMVASCAPASTVPPSLPDGRRKKLWELAPHLLASVFGTCLSPAQLRKVVAKGKGYALRSLSDRAVQEEAVRGVTHHTTTGKFLHKALDRHHETAIQQFHKAQNADEVFSLWEAALRSGNIPGAYWALLTHPTAPEELKEVACGDVHMRSHLAGVARRPDIQRLTALEADNAKLTRTVETQQEQLRDALSTREATHQHLHALLAQQHGQERDAPASPRAQEQADEMTTLREVVVDLQKHLATAEWRCVQVEQRYQMTQAALSEATAALGAAHEEAQCLRDELAAIEAQLWATHGDEEEPRHPLPVSLKGTLLLYVGGRPGHIQHMRALLEGVQAELLHHDGGQEERTGLLAGLVRRADAVFFPIDCISHEAAMVVKRLCRQAGKPYLPLRSASLTSFMAGVRRCEWPALEGSAHP